MCLILDFYGVEDTSWSDSAVLGPLQLFDDVGDFWGPLFNDDGFLSLFSRGFLAWSLLHSLAFVFREEVAPWSCRFFSSRGLLAFSSRLLSSGLHGIVRTIHQMILVGRTTDVKKLV